VRGLLSNWKRPVAALPVYRICPAVQSVKSFRDQFTRKVMPEAYFVNGLAALLRSQRMGKLCRTAQNGAGSRLGAEADSEQRLGYWPLRNSVVGVSRFITNFLIKIMIKNARFKGRPILYSKRNTNYVRCSRCSARFLISLLITMILRGTLELVALRPNRRTGKHQGRPSRAPPDSLGIGGWQLPRLCLDEGSTNSPGDGIDNLLGRIMGAPLNLFQTPNADLGPCWPPVSKGRGPLSPEYGSTDLRLKRRPLAG
jgi:hypothetical protein